MKQFGSWSYFWTNVADSSRGFEKNESLNCLEAKQNKTLKVSSLVLIWQIAFAELADVMSFSTVFGTTEYCNGYDDQI